MFQIACIDDEGNTHTYITQIEPEFMYINRTKAIYLLNKHYNIPRMLLKDSHLYYIPQDKIDYFYEHNVLNERMVKLNDNYVLLVCENIINFLQEESIKMLQDSDPIISNETFESKMIDKEDLRKPEKKPSPLKMCEYFNDIDFLKTIMLMKQNPDTLTIARNYLSTGSIYSKFNIEEVNELIEDDYNEEEYKCADDLLDMIFSNQDSNYFKLFEKFKQLRPDFDDKIIQKIIYWYDCNEDEVYRYLCLSSTVSFE
jgi:hypothetical protein